jgi:hypothetical protein
MEIKMPFEFSEVLEDSLEEFVYEGSSFSFSKEEESDYSGWLNYYEDQAIDFID